MSSDDPIIKIPEFDWNLVWSIQRIAPHYDFSSPDADDEVCRQTWETDQNGMSKAEYEALLPVLQELPANPRVLEIGVGLGRSLIYFSKKMGWSASSMFAYDGEGRFPQYMTLGLRSATTFCGSFEDLDKILSYNDVKGVTIYDAASIELKSIPEKFDFIYSFFAVGFHWAIEYFIDDIASLMKENTVAVFTVPSFFEIPRKLSRYQCRVLEWTPFYPPGSTCKLLVLKKNVTVIR